MTSPETIFAWLIERVDNGAYWDGRAVGLDATFSHAHTDAVRFARKEDAERIIAWLLCQHPVVAREHGWVEERSFNND